MITREDFEISLIKQYSAAIDEIVIDCEHEYKAHLDFETLSIKIENVLMAAKLDGLDEAIIWNIVQRRVPSFYDYAMSIDIKIAA